MATSSLWINQLRFQEWFRCRGTGMRGSDSSESIHSFFRHAAESQNWLDYVEGTVDQALRVVLQIGVFPHL